MASWTLEDLTALEKAMKSGAQKVEYNDRTVTYRSLVEMQTLRDLMRRNLGLTKVGGNRILCESSKGIC